ncbi:SOS response-associated peptidase [Pedobacter metabolipauper]|uniref:Abasic site processing protein n=1 Tax=Pedobacter metabolipauper TaxID=425513 RepID=A0A4V3D1R3_9SPHI|nr:SOS response-associated peptidase [Pedobacter metabolipauper]TDQ12183.1 putative SOS response-associated peptidase YedK [Pedobacter metabolipauper]
MCARYTLTRSEKQLLEAYNVKFPEFEPNYNLAPTQNGLVITADEPDIAQKMHFGLVPYWSADTKLNFSTLNARSEGAGMKKTYAPLLVHHKTCLVLADGFYEWDKKSGESIPYRFTLKDREVFAFAGLWSEWKSKFNDDVYRSFTIMTTVANETVGKVHDPKFRMPVILDRSSEKLWLNRHFSVPALLSLCQPYPDDLMNVYQVSKDVNTAAVKSIPNNKQEFILPLNSQ